MNQEINLYDIISKTADRLKCCQNYKEKEYGGLWKHFKDCLERRFGTRNYKRLNDRQQRIGDELMDYLRLAYDYSHKVYPGAPPPPAKSREWWKQWSSSGPVGD